MIGFAGNGHGGKAALISLQEYFTEIEILSEDKELLNLARTTDISHFDHDFSIFNSKVIVCAGYMFLIAKEQILEKIIINTHPSLLPKYRGLHSLAWAILNGEKEIGFTIHLMNEKIDDGDILHQWKIKNQGQSSKFFLDKFDDLIKSELGIIIFKYLKGEIQPIPQNKKNATWVSRRSLMDCQLDFNSTNIELKRFMQALSPPYPYPFFIYKSIKYEVREMEFTFPKYFSTPGKIVNIDNSGIYIKTKDSCVLLSMIFSDDKKVDPKIFKLGVKL